MSLPGSGAPPLRATAPGVALALVSAVVGMTVVDLSVVIIALISALRQPTSSGTEPCWWAASPC